MSEEQQSQQPRNVWMEDKLTGTRCEMMICSYTSPVCSSFRNGYDRG